MKTGISPPSASLGGSVPLGLYSNLPSRPRLSPLTAEPLAPSQLSPGSVPSLLLYPPSLGPTSGSWSEIGPVPCAVWRRRGQKGQAAGKWGLERTPSLSHHRLPALDKDSSPGSRDGVLTPSPRTPHTPSGCVFLPLKCSGHYRVGVSGLYEWVGVRST